MVWFVGGCPHLTRNTPAGTVEYQSRQSGSQEEVGICEAVLRFLARGIEREAGATVSAGMFRTEGYVFAGGRLPLSEWSTCAPWLSRRGSAEG